MAKETVKKRHHTTPKVHLRGFADDDLSVTIRTRSGVERDVHITNVTVRNGFYNARNSEGILHDHVENWFSKDIESPASPVLDRLRHDVSGPVVATDVAITANFVAAQLYRTPTARLYMEQNDARLGPLLMVDAVGRQHGFSFWELDDRERVQHMAAAKRVLDKHHDPDAVRASQLRTMAREIDAMMTRLYTYDWEVLESDDPCLITGDVPAVGLQPHIGAFAGILPKASPVFMPLARTRLLAGRPSGARPRRRISAHLARAVNFRIAYEAAEVIVKAKSQDWPPLPRLAPSPPRLPPLPVERRRSATPGSSTFPARYPEVASASIRNLLEILEATSIVQ